MVEPYDIVYYKFDGRKNLFLFLVTWVLLRTVKLCIGSSLSLGETFLVNLLSFQTFYG